MVIELLVNHCLVHRFVQISNSKDQLKIAMDW